MKKLWKKIYRQYLVYSYLLKGNKFLSPPHVVKQLSIQKLAKDNGCKILVETGTYLGDMVQAQLSHFDKIYSIELDEKLYLQATERFKNVEKVNVLQGDSGSVLKKILPQLNERSLFWLDGHYSGGVTATISKELETPIMEELKSILGCVLLKYVILIDDARCFNGKNGYPTLDQIRKFIESEKKGLVMTVKNDAIIIK